MSASSWLCAHVPMALGVAWHGWHRLRRLRSMHAVDGLRCTAATFQVTAPDFTPTPPRVRPPPPAPRTLQGYLEERVKGGARWSWSALRPNPVCGFRRAGSGHDVKQLAGRKQGRASCHCNARKWCLSSPRIAPLHCCPAPCSTGAPWGVRPWSHVPWQSASGVQYSGFACLRNSMCLPPGLL